MFKRLIVISAALAFVAPATASGHPVAPSRFLETAKPYTPYEFLIGDWDSKLDGGLSIHQQFKWGPGGSYISYATYMVEAGKPEHLHFEGMMVWNGKSKALDFLFTVEPPSGVEEKGQVLAEADGSIVRDVEMTDAKGAIAHFRQTFRRTGENVVVTSLLQQTDKGWVPSSPGSDHIVMNRKSS